MWDEPPDDSAALANKAADWARKLPTETRCRRTEKESEPERVQDEQVAGCVGCSLIGSSLGNEPNKLAGEIVAALSS